VFVATTGSDSNACTAAAPCASFDRAFRVAKAGQVVEIRAGTYPSQDVGADSSKTGPGVVLFRPAAGATVTVPTLMVDGGAFLTFRGFRALDALRVYNLDPGTVGSRNVTFENMGAQTIKIVGQVKNITVRGGVYGDTMDWQPQIAKANQGDPESSRPNNILIENATFRNYLRSGSSVHTECLQVINVDGLMVRNSTFNNCDGTGDIGITDGPHNNITFENNFMGKAGDAYYSMQITKNVTNLTLRNNTSSKAAVFSDTERGGPYVITGNYFPFSSGLCQPEGTYSHNVFAGGKCGATDFNAPAMRFVDENGFNLHLAPNSEAIDRGDPASFPAQDIDGQARPMGAAPDAGADELR
jgi:hypothetical protein